MEKPIHVKPSLYAFYFELLKGIALKYGYNLVLHGSMARDLDLVAIPWQKEIGDKEAMMSEFAEALGGEIMQQTEEQLNCFPNGRLGYVININRGEFTHNDPQYYLDISVIPDMNAMSNSVDKKFCHTKENMIEFARYTKSLNVISWEDDYNTWTEKHLKQ